MIDSSKFPPEILEQLEKHLRESGESDTLVIEIVFDCAEMFAELRNKNPRKAADILFQGSRLLVVAAILLAQAYPEMPLDEIIARIGEIKVDEIIDLEKRLADNNRAKANAPESTPESGT